MTKIFKNKNASRRRGDCTQTICIRVDGDLPEHFDRAIWQEADASELEGLQPLYTQTLDETRVEFFGFL